MPVQELQPCLPNATFEFTMWEDILCIYGNLSLCIQLFVPSFILLFPTPNFPPRCLSQPAKYDLTSTSLFLNNFLPHFEASVILYPFSSLYSV